MRGIEMEAGALLGQRSEHREHIITFASRIVGLLPLPDYGTVGETGTNLKDVCPDHDWTECPDGIHPYSHAGHCSREVL